MREALSIGPVDAVLRLRDGPAAAEGTSHGLTSGGGVGLRGRVESDDVGTRFGVDVAIEDAGVEAP